MLWTLPPLLIVLVAALYPLIRVCLESTKVGETQRGWSTWAEVLGSEMFRDALWRTVAIAATSTAGCLLLGTFLAIVLAFVPFPGSRVVGRLI
jgi:2-aminoethylphosphonate transport system permease protein